MGKVYEKSLLGYQHYADRKVEAPARALAGLPEGSKEGRACGRLGCGGLVVLRSVETEEGSCDELVCVACSRTQLVKIREPYKPLPVEVSKKVAGLLREKNGFQGSEGKGEESGDVELPEGFLVALDAITD